LLKSSVSREDVLKFYPDAPKSKVVRTHYGGAWNGEDLMPDSLRQMLNTSIVELTGLEAPRDAWSVLFSPKEKIAIKVNSVWGGVTHPELVMALTDCLQDSGVPAEQIVIFDRYTQELQEAGFTINKDGVGVRCYGTDDDGPRMRSSSTPGERYSTGWKIMDVDIGLSEVLLDCDALINVPILKRGGGDVGISFAMKNHYGTFDKPMEFHGEKFEHAIPELNALPPIKDRTRLIIGDALATQSFEGLLDRYEVMDIGSTLLMSFDPVAFDAVGLQMVVDKLNLDGRESFALFKAMGAEPWLAVGAELGLGTNDPANIELVDLKLS
jgi:hypothetical protein